MNIQQIKESGVRLSLEAELSVQLRNIKGFADKRQYKNALQCANDTVELITELIPLVNEPISPTTSNPETL